MSPSEAAGLSLGVVLEKVDRLETVRGVRRRFYRFGAELKGRRHTLKVIWHTKAGAWQAAVRWVKRLQRGEL
jgi:hypothetical protein